MKKARNKSAKANKAKVKKNELFGKEFKLFLPDEYVILPNGKKKKYKGRSISRLLTYRNNGFNLKGGNEETFAVISKSSFIRTANAIYDKIKKQRKNSHKGDPKDEQVQKLENAVLKCLPESDFAKTLKGWEESKSGDKEVDFNPLKPIELKGLLLALMTKEVVDFEVEDKSVAVTGRNNKYSTLLPFVSAVNYVHSLAGVESPAEDIMIKEILNEHKKEYFANGAPSAEPVEFFNKMRVTIFSDCYSAFVQVRNWALFMFMVIIFARPSEVCYYCPTVNNIEIPDKSTWGPNGYPKFIKLGLHHWKGKKLKEVYFVIIHCNYVNPLFCPVFAILSWLYVSGITEGPLFPTFTKHKTEKRIIKGPYSKIRIGGGIHWYGYSDSGEPKSLSMGYQYLWGVLDELFRRAGYNDARPYTIRKTATKWGARTGGREFELKLTGRWQQWSEHFYKYVEEGLSEGREHKLCDKMDPIRKILVYKPTCFSAALTNNSA